MLPSGAVGETEDVSVLKESSVSTFLRHPAVKSDAERVDKAGERLEELPSLIFLLSLKSAVGALVWQHIRLLHEDEHPPRPKHPTLENPTFFDAPFSHEPRVQRRQER